MCEDGKDLKTGRMASSVERQVSQHLECAVCLERLKEPKMLSCQHTYCRECLEKLFNTDGRRRNVYEIKCPECRKKTRVPRGEVKKLPNNLFVEKISSDLDYSQSTKIPPCKEHEDEVLKLFCKDCDQLICRDCILIDHRDHCYKFVKDIYPAEKKKIEKVVDEAVAKIHDLEATVKEIDRLETRAQESCKDASLKVDVFIDKQVAMLEKARKRLKDDLRKLSRSDNEGRQKQRDSLSAKIQSLRKGVEFAKQSLKKAHAAEVLGAKKEIVESLSGKLRTRDGARHDHNMTTYHFEVSSPLNEELVKKMAMVKKQVKGCNNNDDDDDDDDDDYDDDYYDDDDDYDDDNDYDDDEDDDDDDDVYDDDDDDDDACLQPINGTARWW